jgi:DNA-binding SARP family transcriptional activator
MAIEHAGSKGQADLFEQATDAVVQDLDDETVSPWVLGLWLVAFGSVSGRYFPYARRHFPYADAEEALRAAIALGEREGFRSVEFGALYHLQYQMKLRNNLSELSVLIERLAEIADSRHTTQAAVVADCQAALHTMRGAVADAHAACARIMVAVEAADEPPIERWPHFITQFQAHLAGRDPVEAARRLTELLPLFDGAVRERTQVCVRIAEALDARWNRPRAYPQRLRIAVEALREANWSAALANLPDLLADLLADALDLGVETDFCRRLIRQRRLSPPERRPPDWPWALKVHVLGGFRLELDGAPLDLGPKPAARSLDLLRALAVAKGHTCALADLHDWLWSDADGDMAKAACEQALNRLRKLLGRSDLIVQREGKLRLAMNAVWVDLDHWEARLHDLIDARGQDATSAEALRDLLATFPGAPLAHEREGPWTAAAAERVRGKVVEAALRLAGRYEDVGDAAKARAVHLRALDVYPDAASIHEALIAGRLARDDVAGAREDYARFTKTWPDDPDAPPSATFQALFTRATKVAGGEGGSP